MVAIKLHLGFWKGLRALIEKHDKTLAPVKMIVPTGISYWSTSKVHIDVKSRLLKHINPKVNVEYPVDILITRSLLMCVTSSFIVAKVLGIKCAELSD